MAAAVEATASLTAAVSEAAASTAAERFAQRERVARASEKAAVAAAAARRAVQAVQTHVREQRLEASREKEARRAEAAGAVPIHNNEGQLGKEGDNDLGEGAVEDGDGIGAGCDLANISWDEDALEACLELSANDAAADGLVKSTTRAEEKVLMKLDPRVWTEPWDPVAALLAELPTRRQSATRTTTSTTAAPPSAGPFDEEADNDDDSTISSSSDIGGSSAANESPRRKGGRSSRVLAMASPPSFLRKRRPALDSEPAPAQQEKHDAVSLQSNAAKNQSKSSSRNDEDGGGNSENSNEDCDDDDDAREALSARELEWLEARMADADQVSGWVALGDSEIFVRICALCDKKANGRLKIKEQRAHPQGLCLQAPLPSSRTLSLCCRFFLLLFVGHGNCVGEVRAPRGRALRRLDQRDAHRARGGLFTCLLQPSLVLFYLIYFTPPHLTVSFFRISFRSDVPSFFLPCHVYNLDG